MEVTSRLTDRLAQPEYTGANRCRPCTVVNVVIAVGLSLSVVAIGWSVLDPTVASSAGLGVLGVGLVLIYYRGYLVPGTPSLTKRYMPTWALRAFGKAPPTPTDGDLDPEAVLTGVGALEDCPDASDLCLTDRFRSAWYEAIDRVADADADKGRLLDVLGIEGGDVEIREYEQAFQVYVGSRRVGIWPSEAAFLADLGGASVLADQWAGWPDLPIDDRAHLLNGLRLFIDRCPTCGSVPSFGTEAVESCCASYDVAAVECEGCGARLFESGPIDDAAASGSASP